MEPSLPQSTWACARSTSAMGLYQHEPGCWAIANTDKRSVQDTSRTAAAKRTGTYLPPATEVQGQEQAMNMDDCAAQLRQLQERVEFLERYVFELLPPPSQERLTQRQPRPFTPEEINILLEGLQRSITAKPPEEE